LFALPKAVRVGILERLPLRDLRALCNASKKFEQLLCGGGGAPGDATYLAAEYMTEVWQTKLREDFGTALRADECRARTGRERAMIARSLEAYLAGTRGLERTRRLYELYVSLTYEPIRTRLVPTHHTPGEGVAYLQTGTGAKTGTLSSVPLVTLRQTSALRLAPQFSLETQGANAAERTIRYARIDRTTSPAAFFDWPNGVLVLGEDAAYELDGIRPALRRLFPPAPDGDPRPLPVSQFGETADGTRVTVVAHGTGGFADAEYQTHERYDTVKQVALFAVEKDASRLRVEAARVSPLAKRNAVYAARLVLLRSVNNVRLSAAYRSLIVPALLTERHYVFWHRSAGYARGDVSLVFAPLADRVSNESILPADRSLSFAEGEGRVRTVFVVFDMPKGAERAARFVVVRQIYRTQVYRAEVEVIVVDTAADGTIDVAHAYTLFEGKVALPGTYRVDFWAKRYVAVTGHIPYRMPGADPLGDPGTVLFDVLTGDVRVAKKDPQIVTGQRFEYAFRALVADLSNAPPPPVRSEHEFEARRLGINRSRLARYALGGRTRLDARRIAIDPPPVAI